MQVNHSLIVARPLRRTLLSLFPDLDVVDRPRVIDNVHVEPDTLRLIPLSNRLSRLKILDLTSFSKGNYKIKGGVYTNKAATGQFRIAVRSASGLPADSFRHRHK